MKTFLTLFLITVTLSAQEIQLDYPVLDKSSVIDTYKGLKVIDDYRDLEDLDKSENWYNSQQQLAQQILSSINGRDEMLKDLLEYSTRRKTTIFKHKINRTGAQFYLKREKDDNVSRLYYKKNSTAKEIQLYDPKDYDSSLKNAVISYFQPSWDATKVVIAITHSGREIADLIILNVLDKETLPQVLTGARPDSFLGVSWLPDDSGFTYLKFSENKEDKTNYAVLYKLGDSPTSLVKVFGHKVHSNINISSDGVYPIATINNPEDKFVIGYLATVENFWEAYISKIDDFKKGKPVWRKFYTTDDNVFTSKGIFEKQNYIFKSNLNNPSNAVYSISVIDTAFAKAQLLCKPSGDEILKDFLVKNNKIFYTTTKDGVQSFLYLCNNESAQKIKLPENAGKISITDNPSKENSFFISLSSWTTKNKRYSFDMDTFNFRRAPLSGKVEFPEFENIISKEVQVRGHDGVQIPVSIIYQDDIALDGQNPTLFYSYGAYGTSIEPFYSSVFLHWVAKGGVFCVPHVRGGGEKGEQWHKDGMMDKKSNTWKDLISATEYLIDNRYTSNKKTAIYSMSAGGIMIGRALSERPDLFAVAIAEVPILNPLRSEFRDSKGGSNKLEYGTVEDFIQAKGLLEMDAYHKLTNGISYPAILLTAGKNDPRVPLWMPGKFLAKAQAFSTSNRPIIMRIDDEAGHGTTDERIKFYQEYVDVFCFAFWQTGHKDYTYPSGGE